MAEMTPNLLREMRFGVDLKWEPRLLAAAWCAERTEHAIVKGQLDASIEVLEKRLEAAENVVR